MRKLIFLLWILLQWNGAAALAQQTTDFEPIKKSIAEATDEKAIANGIEAAQAVYLKTNQFDELVAFLKGLKRDDVLGQAVINFSIGRARLQEVKYFEDSQEWEQYFSQGESLRKEAVDYLEKSRADAPIGSATGLYANLLLWQYHKDQQDSHETPVFDSLVKAAKDYAQTAKESEPLKKAADVLSSYGEKLRAKEFYSLYFRTFASADMTDEKLFAAATGFLAEGSIDLAESAFDLYNEKIGGYPKEKAVPLYLQIATVMAYRDKSPNDPAYAEKMFARAEAAQGNGVFDESTLYLRAFNLEQGEEFVKAVTMYTRLAENFPSSAYCPEAIFKTALIETYVFGNRTAAQTALEKLTSVKPSDNANVYTVAAFYQLGVIAQWNNDNTLAKEFYTKAIDCAGKEYSETLVLAKKRLAEIESSKPLDFNLKAVLDNSLNPESRVAIANAEIKAPASAGEKEEVSVSAQVTSEPSGCMQSVRSYYWSGDLGTASPGSEQPEFVTAYDDPGVKVVNLVVMSPSGVTGKAIKMITIK